MTNNKLSSRQNNDISCAADAYYTDKSKSTVYALTGYYTDVYGIPWYLDITLTAYNLIVTTVLCMALLIIFVG